MSAEIVATDETVLGESRVAAAPKTAARSGHHPGIALAVIVSVQLMLVLDATIVNIALPDIRNSLGFTTTGLSWVLNAYTLAFGGLLLLGGRAGDILGRRRMFLTGIVLFTIASLIGGFATSSEWLLLTRAAQGVAAAIAAPSALALITTNFKEGPEQSRALGIFSAVSAAGASIGLIAGGMLTSWASWRWIFFVNVPIGIVVALLAPVYIIESDRHRGQFDLVGALTSTIGMVSLVYGFIRAAADGWTDSLTLMSFAIAAILLVSFVITEYRARQPIMPLRLFADRNRASAYLNMFLLVATMLGVFYFLPQFVQEVLGYSAVKAGASFLPLSLIIMATSQTVPRLLPRFGPKPLIVTGASLITIAMIWFSQISATTDYLTGILGPSLLWGIGAGLAIVPLSITIMTSGRLEDSGAASGMLQTTQQIGGSLGVAVLVTVFETAGRDEAKSLSAGLSEITRTHQILAAGMASAFVVAAIIAATALAVAVFAIKTKRV
jgi:EmrB/QacA subfamily drug resistance transporter